MTTDNNRPYSLKIGRLFRTWYLNFVNSFVLVLTWGRRVVHEGRYRRGEWSDWARVFHSRPAQFEQPSSEDEICRIVRDAEKVRAVGAGHSFNAAHVTSATLISLDRYKEVTLRPHPDKEGWSIATVQAGARLRDLNRILHAAGFALSVAGSTDPQSMGGLVATDLHGTGRDHGFLSECTLSLRIVDAGGKVRTFCPGDNVFHAAFGGIGTCGVVIELEIECEPAYNLATAVKLVDREWAEENIEALLAENTHLSFYYFGGFARRKAQEGLRGLARVRMNKWNRTVDPPTRWPRTHRVMSELGDILFSGFLFDIARLLHILNPFARVGFFLYGLTVNVRELVYPSHEGFSRILYFRHDEIEYGIPFETYRECLKEVRTLLLQRRYPTIIEVRFTPERSQALLGPGTGRRTVYLELAPTMSRPTDPIFAEFERIVLKYGGRAHLGKKTYIGREELARMYPPELLERFNDARLSQDPHGKFLNTFTDRLFGGSASGRALSDE